MRGKIYVLMDHSNGQIVTSSWESLTLGQKLADEGQLSLHPVLLGKTVEALAKKVSRFRARSLLLIEHDKLSEYNPDTHCECLCQILSEDQPYLFLMGHTYQNIDLAPKLAAALKKGLVTDCIGYRKEEADFIFVRQMFRNKLNADIRIRSSHPWIITLQAGAYDADKLQPGKTSIVERTVDLSQNEWRRRSLKTYRVTQGKVKLSQAERIVSVGRGIKKADNLAIIEELARVLGAEIGASRPVVDSGWLDRERQIGSSGQTVSPRLYIACGISGAIQHIIGIKNSECIVAINSDPNAPVFSIATYGLVGDLFEVVPALVKRLRQEQANST